MSNEILIDPSIGNVLFLDDMHTRHRQFINRFGMNDKLRIWQAYTAAEAIDLIDRFEREGHRFDQVFLDHDLSTDDIMCPPGGPSKVPTGMDVVDRICRLPFELCPREAFVHTMNPPASEAMAARLNLCLIRTRRVPFDLLVA